MKSDIELFKEYDRELAGTYNKSYYAIDVIRNALSNDTCDMLDLGACQIIIQEIMNYLPLKKKYILLKRELGDKLSMSKDGFKLYEHVFSSLDEVEKALKMKSFL